MSRSASENYELYIKTFNEKKELCKSYHDKIEQLQTELDKHRWIPIEERLPEKDISDVEGPFLVTVSNYVAIATYCFMDKSWMNLRSEFIKPTHWKPIILP